MRSQRSKKFLKIVLFLVPAALVFLGAFWASSAYLALFVMGPSDLDLGSISSSGSASADFTVSFNSSNPYYSGGEAPYSIGGGSYCNQWDDEGINCIDPVPDLCPYISIEPKNGEDTENGFDQNLNESHAAFGQLDRPTDESDDWTVKVTPTCFEGECPADYDPDTYGDPIPKDLEGKTFECDLSVGSTVPPEQVRNFLGTNTAYADDLSDTIKVTAVLNGSTQPGFSNVLFLPGIEGSVLKTGNDTLWPPTIWSNDISQLTLDSSGESVNDIYVDGIINNFYTASIYAPFTDFMDNLVSQGTIHRWLPMAYDWRFSPDKVVSEGIKTADGTEDVIQKIEDLAASSGTGKVTIVAHSMGGLLGKAIIKELQNEGKDDLIDSFVMVGTPQLGTPEAIGSLLHGDGQRILGGFITNPASMRAIGQNMQGAYDLLPSEEYFEKVSDPVIAFDSLDPFIKSWRDFWGSGINTYASMAEFLTGQGVSRSQPLFDDLSTPAVLNSDFVSAADSFHNEFDNYQMPGHIRVVQVAGWGVPTVKAVKYTLSHGFLGYEDEPTIEGDSTVVYPSAISYNANETYFLNLLDYRKAERSNTQHRDLLSAQSVQNLIDSVIEGKDITEDSYISSMKPPVTDSDDEIIVSTHSPVILGAYDQAGNFTGIDPNQDLSADILAIKEDIPGSTFMYTSDSQEIFLPKDGTYNFIYKGTGDGPTTVDIDNFSGDGTAPVAAYSDIPTTTDTSATFSVDSSAPEDTLLAVDTDGDGQTDETVSPDGSQPQSLDELIASLRAEVESFNVKDKTKQNLLKEIDRLEKRIQNKAGRNAKIIANLEKNISNKELRGKINAEDANDMTNLLTQLEAGSESAILDPAVLEALKGKIESLDIKKNQKDNLLNRVTRLEREQGLIQTLSNMEAGITRKNQHGRINDTDAQALLDLLTQIEGVI